MNRTNAVDAMFNDLCSDIDRDYKSPEDKFLLHVYSTEEIIEMGFCKKSIDRIMAEAPVDAIEEYFESVIKDLKAEDVGGFDITDSAGITTVGQFIIAVKRTAVRGYLNMALSAFIRKLKQE